MTCQCHFTSKCTLARVVLRAGKFEHITPALIQLHWLPALAAGQTAGHVQTGSNNFQYFATQ